MLTGSQVERKIHHYATAVFGTSFRDYLTRADRSLLGLEGDRSKRQYRALFGAPPSQLITAATARFVDAHAGYRVDAGKAFTLTSPLNADVFVISTELLAAPEPDVDTVIIHELCHWALDGRPLAKAALTPDSKDVYHGGKLYRLTDTENEHLTRHTREFCALLSASARVFVSQTSAFPDRSAVVNSAMRFDLRT